MTLTCRRPSICAADFHPDTGVTFYKARRSPAIQAALATEPFQRFLEFVQYPIWISEPAAEREHATVCA